MPREAQRWTHMLGGLTAFFILLLILSGVYLGQFYDPTPSGAHDSVQYIITRAPLGDWIRSVHYFSAGGAVAAIVAHLILVFRRRAYRRPREVTWWAGVAMAGLLFLLLVTGTALRMGAANIAVLLITSALAWFLNTFLLREAPYLRLISFIVVIASVVQIVEMTVKKYSPVLFRELGIFLPLITTNCAILGLAIFQANRGYGFLQGVFFALGAGLGLTLALVLMASIRERVELSDVPSVARGLALNFFIAGFLSLAFMGFAGLGT